MTTFKNQVTPVTHAVTCVMPSGEEIPVSMGESGDAGDVTIMIMVDDDGDVYEWFNSGTPWETVQNFATGAATLLICAGYEDHELVQVALRERELYADCFGIEVR